MNSEYKKLKREKDRDSAFQYGSHTISFSKEHAFENSVWCCTILQCISSFIFYVSMVLISIYLSSPKLIVCNNPSSCAQSVRLISFSVSILCLCINRDQVQVQTGFSTCSLSWHWLPDKDSWPGCGLHFSSNMCCQHIYSSGAKGGCRESWFSTQM